MASRAALVAAAAPWRVRRGSLADQAVQAALSYRTQQPLIDALLKELGLKGGSLSGLTEGINDPASAAPAATPPAGDKPAGKK